MFKEFHERGSNLGQVNELHGWGRDFKKILDSLGVSCGVKEIYEYLLES